MDSPSNLHSDGHSGQGEVYEDEIENVVSRTGRVRKKSSKFADFESPDEIDAFYKKKIFPNKILTQPKTANIEETDSDSSSSDDSSSDSDSKDGYVEDWGDNVGHSTYATHPAHATHSAHATVSGHAAHSAHVAIMDDFNKEAEDADDDDDDDDDDFGNEENLQVNSLYFSEKKKPSLKDVLSVKKKKAERKDKGKPRFTAYMLWAKATRPSIVEDNPNMDFSTVNKRLGQMWAHIPTAQKHHWKRKAKKLEGRGEKSETPRRTMIRTGKGGAKGNPKPTVVTKPSVPSKPAQKGKMQHNYRGGGGTTKAESAATSLSQNVASQKTMYQTPKSGKSPAVQVMSDGSPPSSFKVTGTSPIDVAAHLKLLGESLNNIGQKLKEHEGQIAVSGSLSVLLDSMLCVLGPLACLSNQLEETQGAISDQTLADILDNIAYIMPGIV